MFNLINTLVIFDPKPFSTLLKSMNFRFQLQLVTNDCNAMLYVDM